MTSASALTVEPGSPAVRTRRGRGFDPLHSSTKAAPRRIGCGPERIYEGPPMSFVRRDLPAAEMPEQRDRVVRHQQVAEVGKRRAKYDCDADFLGEIKHFQQDFDVMGISKAPGRVAGAAGIVLQEAPEEFPGEIVCIAGPGSILLEFFLKSPATRSQQRCRKSGLARPLYGMVSRGARYSARFRGASCPRV